MGMLLEMAAGYIALLPILILIEVIICRQYRKRKTAVSKGFKIGWQIYALLLSMILYVTGAGGIDDMIARISRFNSDAVPVFSADEINIIPIVNWGVEDFLGLTLNAIMFIPFGVLVPMIWKKTDFLHTVLAGFCFSVLIELSQLFVLRATDIDDLIMNTLGTVIGYGNYRLMFKRFNRLQTDYNDSFAPLTSTAAIFAGYFLIGSTILKSVWRLLAIIIN